MGGAGGFSLRSFTPSHAPMKTNPDATINEYAANGPYARPEARAAMASARKPAAAAPAAAGPHRVFTHQENLTRVAMRSPVTNSSPAADGYL